MQYLLFKIALFTTALSILSHAKGASDVNIEGPTTVIEGESVQYRVGIDIDWESELLGSSLAFLAGGFSQPYLTLAAEIRRVEVLLDGQLIGVIAEHANYSDVENNPFNSSQVCGQADIFDPTCVDTFVSQSDPYTYTTETDPGTGNPVIQEIDRFQGVSSSTTSFSTQNSSGIYEFGWVWDNAFQPAGTYNLEFRGQGRIWRGFSSSPTFNQNDIDGVSRVFSFSMQTQLVVDPDPGQFSVPLPGAAVYVLCVLLMLVTVCAKKSRQVI